LPASTGLGVLRPRERPGLSPSGAQSRDRRSVDPSQYLPCRRGRGHRAEHLRLLAQHREIADRLAAVGEQHRQIHRDAARHVPAGALTQGREHVDERGFQPGGLCQIRQQPGPGVADDASPVARDGELGTRRSSLHLEGAFLLEELTLDKPDHSSSEGTFACQGHDADVVDHALRS